MYSQALAAYNQISTHAPLARCDLQPRARASLMAISTHAPLARCDLLAAGRATHWWLFQLTHLLRGATAVARTRDMVDAISTHAPLARCDCSPAHLRDSGPFQLTHLLRGATPYGRQIVRWVEISTHAPLARCDRLSKNPWSAREGQSPLEFQSCPAACTVGTGGFLRRKIPFSRAKIVSLQFLRPEI